MKRLAVLAAYLALAAFVAGLLLAFPVAAQQWPITFSSPAGTTSPLPAGEMVVTYDAASNQLCFRWPSNPLPLACVKPSGKFFAQSLELTDHGDAIDINVQRIGGAQGGGKEPTKPHERIFNLCGQSYSDPMPTAYHCNASYSQRQGPCTVSPTSRCGYHEFRTTRPGSLMPLSGSLGGTQLEIHPQDLNVRGHTGLRLFPANGDGRTVRETNTFVRTVPCNVAGMLCLVIPAQ